MALLQGSCEPRTGRVEGSHALRLPSFLPLNPAGAVCTVSHSDVEWEKSRECREKSERISTEWSDASGLCIAAAAAGTV